RKGRDWFPRLFDLCLGGAIEMHFALTVALHEDKVPLRLVTVKDLYLVSARGVRTLGGSVCQERAIRFWKPPTASRTAAILRAQVRTGHGTTREASEITVGY